MSPERDNVLLTVTKNLRTLLARGAQIVAPGAADALSARQIEAHGHECVYIGSYATAAARYGRPDTGRLSLKELVEHAASIAAAVRIPVIADAEAFDDAVPAFEAAGVSAIHVEDHTGAGKHTSGPQQLHGLRAAADRIAQAVRARKNPDFLVVARSDAFWVHRDLDDCIARLNAYAEAGADMVFPTLVGQAELAEVRKRVPKPVMIVNNAEEQHEGAAVVLYYAFAVVTQFDAVQRALAVGKLAAATQPLEDFLGYKDEGRKNR